MNTLSGCWKKHIFCKVNNCSMWGFGFWFGCLGFFFVVVFVGLVVLGFFVVVVDWVLVWLGETTKLG